MLLCAGFEKMRLPPKARLLILWVGEGEIYNNNIKLLINASRIALI